jgi:hypothetical protein
MQFQDLSDSNRAVQSYIARVIVDLALTVGALCVLISCWGGVVSAAVHAGAIVGRIALSAHTLTAFRGSRPPATTLCAGPRVETDPVELMFCMLENDASLRHAVDGV